MAGVLTFWTRKSPRPPIDGALPVRTADELLAGHHARLEAIREIAGVPRDHWDRLYFSLFRAYARFVQDLPASEAHHHAGPGGMLAHGLEVVLQALKLRRGHLLPAGATAEDLAAQQDLWTYATATAGLLHDIGKPVTDQQVTLYDPKGVCLGHWDPWLGPMLETTAWYRIEFVRGRPYRLHEKVAPLLVRLFLPEPGLRWLTSNLAVFEPWLAILTGNGEAAGKLGEIVHQADRLSVSGDLAGHQARLPTARVRPLHERLVTGLRYLLDQGEVPLNRKGAAGWLTGEDLWLVSKRILDLLREHLEREGQGGIPSRNDRLMDELQQHNMLIPNNERAVWTVRVAIEDWCQTLTVLRFPASRLWPDPSSRPEPLIGSVVPVEEAEGDVCVEAKEAVAGDSPTAVTSSRSATGSAVAMPPVPPTKEDPTQTATLYDSAVSNPGNKADSASTPVATVDDPGTRFLNWLRQGLANNQFAINAVNARLHVAQEGLLLISPGIFKDFDGKDWNHVQKRFQKLKLHRKTAQGTNIFTYTVKGERRQSRIKVMVIANSDRVFPGVTLPPPNPYLSPLE